MRSQSSGADLCADDQSLISVTVLGGAGENESLEVQGAAINYVIGLVPP